MGTVNSFPLSTLPIAEVLQSLNFALYRSTSTTSLAIGTGAKTFTTQANKDFVAGDFVVATSDANPTNYMFGQVTSYATTSLVLGVTQVGGSGSHTDWTIREAGPAGAVGAPGATGPGYTASSTTSIAIASSGSKAFTVAAGLAYSAGARVRATESAGSTAWMEGVVTAYSGTTLTFTADKSSGAGTFAAWNINVAGQFGADGAGTGDVTGPSSSVDSEVAIYNSTTGKVIKRASVTGIAKLTSGVLSAATDGTDILSSTTGRKQGLETISIPAAAMWPRTTNGPGIASRELTTSGDVMIRGWAFDTTTEEAVQFYINFPKSWNKGTITFRCKWTNAAGLTTETVSWGLSAGAFTDDDPIDSTELGTEVRVSDTWLAQNDLHVTAVSGAVTVGNTPIDGDLVIGQIARSVANDNMTGDAELLSVEIFFTTSAATDT